jgi:hypothetical protein
LYEELKLVLSLLNWFQTRLKNEIKFIELIFFVLKLKNKNSENKTLIINKIVKYYVNKKHFKLNIFEPTFDTVNDQKTFKYLASYLNTNNNLKKLNEIIEIFKINLYEELSNFSKMKKTMYKTMKKSVSFLESKKRKKDWIKEKKNLKKYIDIIEQSSNKT